MLSKALVLAGVAASAVAQVQPSVTVKGPPAMGFQQAALQSITAAAGTTTYAVLVDGRDSVTITDGPNFFGWHAVYPPGPQAPGTLTADFSCEVTQATILAQCQRKMSGTGLSPEEQDLAAKANAQGAQSFPVQGPKAVQLTTLTFLNGNIVPLPMPTPPPGWEQQYQQYQQGPPPEYAQYNAEAEAAPQAAAITPPSAVETGAAQIMSE